MVRVLHRGHVIIANRRTDLITWRLASGVAEVPLRVPPFDDRRSAVGRG
jgi:hypothetical protein